MQVSHAVSHRTVSATALVWRCARPVPCSAIRETVNLKLYSTFCETVNPKLCPALLYLAILAWLCCAQLLCQSLYFFSSSSSSSFLFFFLALCCAS